MRHKRTKSIRWIDGREYLQAGRADSKEIANEEAAVLRKSWDRVRVIKNWDFDYVIFVHGMKYK